MEEKKNKTINWINAIKAFCIIFVFLRHIGSYYGCSTGIIGDMFIPFYVNAFFFVSGYLLFWKQLSSPIIDENRRAYLLRGGGKVLLSNVFFRIVIPSILFSIIEFVPSCLIQGRNIDVSSALFKTIGGGTYWFTSALVVAELVLLLLFCSRKRNIWFYTVICLILGVVSLVLVRFGPFNNSLWMWKQGLIALIFLSMGGLYWQYEKQIDKFLEWWIVILMLAIYVLLILFGKNTNPLVSTLQIQPWGFLTSAISCLLLVWFCKKLPEIKPLTFIGQNSIGFYFMSGALPVTLSMLAHKLVVGSPIWMMLMIWLACLMVAYVSVMMINRWLPWLWDLRKIKKV